MGYRAQRAPTDKSCYIPTSNEKLLLYIDAPFAKDKTGGAAAAANRHGVYFALAHELQHMIHYYQRILIGKRRKYYVAQRAVFVNDRRPDSTTSL